MSETAPAQGLSRRFWALAAFFVLAPVSSALGALAFAPVQAFCAIGALPPHKRLVKAAASNRAMLLACLFVLVSAASALWSINRETTQWIRTIAGSALGLCFVAAAFELTAKEGLLARRLAVVSALVTMVVLIGIAVNVEFLLARLKGPTSDVRLIANPGRAIAYLLCGVWPIIVLLLGWGRKGIAGAAATLIGAFWLSLQFDLTANTVAFALSLVVFALGWFAPRIVLTGVGGASALGILAAPWIAARLPEAASVPASMPWSWAVRLDIWRFTAEKALERPVLGWGIDASRSFTRVSELRGMAYPVPGQHPHSASLQIWFETGFIGAALAAAALTIGGWMLGRALQGQRAVAASLAASWTAFWGIANLAHGLWQEWFVTAPFTIAVLTILLQRGADPHARQGE